MEQQQVLVSQWEWERGAPYPADKVSVRNIRLTASAGLDVWGRRKEQPVLISVSLSLARSFQSAAEGDVVDHSTIHYGKLSKNIIASVQSKTSAEWHSTDHLARLVREMCLSTGTSIDVLAASEVDIFYPKASMLGEGAGYRLSTNYDNEEVSALLHLRNIRVPTIIGVNSHERQLKQVVVANLCIDKLSQPEAADLYTKAEQILTKTIGDSDFETLESLATKVASEVGTECFRFCSPGASLRLRVEKPVAVPFADAPAIEIVRIKEE